MEITNTAAASIFRDVTSILDNVHLFKISVSFSLNLIIIPTTQRMLIIIPTLPHTHPGALI